MARKKKEKEVVEAVEVDLQEATAPIAPEDVEQVTLTADDVAAPEDTVAPAIEAEVEDEKAPEAPEEDVVEDVQPAVIEVKAPTSSFVELFVDKASSVTGYVDPEKFAPSLSGWWTTDNDKKKRPSFGIHINTKIGKFGTIRIDEDGKIVFMKHTNFDQLVKEYKKEILTKGSVIDEFVAVKRDDKKVLETKKIFVKLA